MAQLGFLRISKRGPVEHFQLIFHVSTLSQHYFSFVHLYIVPVNRIKTDRFYSWKSISSVSHINLNIKNA